MSPAAVLTKQWCTLLLLVLASTGAAMAQPQLQVAITDRIQAVATLSTDDVVAIGKRTGLSESLVIRINDDGTVPWAFSLGDEVILQEIHVTNTDGIIVTGRLTDSLTNEVHAMLALFDATGTLQWSRWMGCGSPNEPLMSSSYGSGSIHLATVTTGPYQSKALIRLFTSGFLSWAVVSGSTFPGYDLVRRLANNDVLYAHRSAPTGEIMRVDGTGSIVWVKRLELDGSDNNAVMDAATLPNGNVLVAFRNTSVVGNTLFTVELDATGSTVPGSARGYGIDTVGGAWGCGMVVDGDGQRTFHCSTNNFTKTDLQAEANGTVQWVFRAATAPAAGAGLARYSDDHLLVVNSDGGNWNHLEATSDSSPALQCATSDTVPTTTHTCTTTDITGALVPVACVPNTFIPSITPVTITTGGLCGTVGSIEQGIPQKWMLHPVPVADVLWVSGPAGSGAISMLEIIDTAGRRWSREVGHDPRNGMDVSHLSPGAYVLRLHDHDRILNLRFLR